MPRKPTGQVLERRGKRGRTFALRFRAYGQRQYITLGSEGWDRQRAEQELQNVLADVRRGLWQPPAPEPEVKEPEQEPTFHEFASEWLAARELEGLSAKTLSDFHWSLERHLLPHVAPFRLSQITVREIERYKSAKLEERARIETERAAAEARGESCSARPLSNSSVNHTLRHLSQILETAVDYELIGSNPATGKRRRLKTERPSRPCVEPEQLMALLDATSGVGRALLALLAGGGLRIGEALSLRWRNVELGTGTIHVVTAKTEKGVREVHMTPALREELTAWKLRSRFTDGSDHVIATSSGKRQNPSNLRRDVLMPAIATANTELEEVGIAPMGRSTFHSLRRTYASLRCACGDDVRYTADQLGHEDPRFTLRVYAQATKRRDRLTGPHLRAYDRALEWARMGTTQPSDVPTFDTEATKIPA
jgi:integrase